MNLHIKRILCPADFSVDGWIRDSGRRIDAQLTVMGTHGRGAVRACVGRELVAR